MKQAQLVANIFVPWKFKKDQQTLLLSPVKWSNRKKDSNKIRFLVIVLHSIWICPREKNKSWDKHIQVSQAISGRLIGHWIQTRFCRKKDT